MAALTSLHAPDTHRTPDTLDDLVVDHLPLSRSLARRYAGRGVELDDLEQVACLALVRAARGFEESRGAFAPFAAASIRGEIKKYFRDYAWSVRPPRRLQELQAAITAATAERPGRVDADAVAEQLGVDVDQVREALAVSGAYAADSLDRPIGVGPGSVGDTLSYGDDALLAADDRMELAGLLSTLADDDRELLGLRFVEELTQQQVADRLGISQMQVSRRLRRLLDGLREESLGMAA